MARRDSSTRRSKRALPLAASRGRQRRGVLVRIWHAPVRPSDRGGPSGAGRTRRRHSMTRTSLSVPIPSVAGSEKMPRPPGDCRPGIQISATPHAPTAPHQQCYDRAGWQVQTVKIYTLTLSIRGPNK